MKKYVCLIVFGAMIGMAIQSYRIHKLEKTLASLPIPREVKLEQKGDPK